MARTASEILQSMTESLRAIDRSADVVKGPVYNYCLRPVPDELEKTEADVERLTQLTTQQIDDVITQDEINAVTNAFSIPQGGGKTSKTRGQMFYAYSRPTQDVVIDRGALVATVDQLYTFIVSRRLEISIDSIDSFYNAATRRYEFVARAEATAVGPDYDVAETRVSKLVTDIDGIDGTVNILAYSGGELAEDIADTVSRVRDKFGGLDPETSGGILSDIRNFDPENVEDVSLVYSKDRQLFKRPTNRPAIDAYVMGEDIDSADLQLTAVGGETRVDLEYFPVKSITSVTVNGSPVDYSFIQDTSLETGRSTRAEDYVLLDSALSASDVLSVTYEYNLLLWEMQENIFSSTERPFDTDVLVREPHPIDVTISVDATAVSSLDPARADAQIKAVLFDKIEPGYFIDILQPDTIRQEIRSSVGGLTNVSITVFHRSAMSLLNVETINLYKSQQSFVDQTTLNVRVRR